MSRLQSAREPISPKDQIQSPIDARPGESPIDACPGERIDAQNLDAQSLMSAALDTLPPRYLSADPFNRSPLPPGSPQIAL